MNKLIRFLYYWLPVLGLAAIIFYQSNHATPNVLPHYRHLDKFLHALVFGVLSALICRAFNSLPRWRDRTLPLMAAATFLAAVYGLSDEWHQSYIPQRSSEMADFVADLVGSSLGCLIYLWITIRRKRRPVAAA